MLVGLEPTTSQEYCSVLDFTAQRHVKINSRCATESNPRPQLLLNVDCLLHNPNKTFKCCLFQLLTGSLSSPITWPVIGYDNHEEWFAVNATEYI